MHCQACLINHKGGPMNPLEKFFLNIFPNKEEKEIISIFFKDLSDEDKLEKLLKENEKDNKK